MIKKNGEFNFFTKKVLASLFFALFLGLAACSSPPKASKTNGTPTPSGGGTPTPHITPTPAPDNYVGYAVNDGNGKPVGTIIDQDSASGMTLIQGPAVSSGKFNGQQFYVVLQNGKEFPIAPTHLMTGPIFPSESNAFNDIYPNLLPRVIGPLIDKLSGGPGHATYDMLVNLGTYDSKTVVPASPNNQYQTLNLDSTDPTSYNDYYTGTVAPITGATVQAYSLYTASGDPMFKLSDFGFPAKGKSSADVYLFALPITTIAKDGITTITIVSASASNTHHL